MINIIDGYMTLMSDNGDIREDLRVPENDVGKDILTKFEAAEEFCVSPSCTFSFCTFKNVRKGCDKCFQNRQTESKLFCLLCSSVLIWVD